MTYKDIIENKNKEIIKLSYELMIKTDFINELLKFIVKSNDIELHDSCLIASKVYEYKIKELKEGKNENKTL